MCHWHYRVDYSYTLTNLLVWTGLNSQLQYRQEVFLMACKRKLISESSKVNLIRGKEINVCNHHFLNLCFRRFKVLSFSINSRQEKWVFKNSVFLGLSVWSRGMKKRLNRCHSLAGTRELNSFIFFLPLFKCLTYKQILLLLKVGSKLKRIILHTYCMHISEPQLPVSCS